MDTEKMGRQKKGKHFFHLLQVRRDFYTLSLSCFLALSHLLGSCRVVSRLLLSAGDQSGGYERVCVSFQHFFASYLWLFFASTTAGSRRRQHSLIVGKEKCIFMPNTKRWKSFHPPATCPFQANPHTHTHWRESAHKKYSQVLQKIISPPPLPPPA